MERIESCSFLELIRRPTGEHTHVCTAGLNFYSVEPQYALCRACPVAGLIAEPICEHLTVHTRLCSSADRSDYVEASLDCEIMVTPWAKYERCERCILLRAKDGYPLVIDSLSPASDSR